jgi:hypothetical protein
MKSLIAFTPSQIRFKLCWLSRGRPVKITLVEGRTKAKTSCLELIKSEMLNESRECFVRGNICNQSKSKSLQVELLWHIYIMVKFMLS